MPIITQLYNSLGGTPSPGGVWKITAAPAGSLVVRRSVNGGAYSNTCVNSLPHNLSTTGDTNPHLVNIDTEYWRPGSYTLQYDLSGIGGSCPPSPATQNITLVVNDKAVNPVVTKSDDPICTICGDVNSGDNITLTYSAESNYNQNGVCGAGRIPTTISYILTWRKMGSSIKVGSNIDPVFTIGVDAPLNDPLSWPDEVIASNLSSCNPVNYVVPISYDLGLNVCSNAQDGIYCYDTSLLTHVLDLRNYVPVSGWAGTSFNWYFLGKNTIGTPTLLTPSGIFNPKTTLVTYNVHPSNNGDVYNFRLEATRPSNPPECTHYVDIEVTIEYAPNAGNFVEYKECFS